MYGELGRDGLGEATYLTKAERELAKRAGKPDEQGEGWEARRGAARIRAHRESTCQGQKDGECS